LLSGEKEMEAQKKKDGATTKKADEDRCFE
jgi:hypothetical protein